MIRRTKKNGLIKLPEPLVEATCKAAIEAWAAYDNLRARGGYPESTGPVGKAIVSFRSGVELPYGLEPIAGAISVVVKHLPEGAAAWFSYPSSIAIDPHKVRFYEDRSISSSLRETVRHELRHLVQFALGAKGKETDGADVWSRWGSPKHVRGMPPRKVRGKDAMSRVLGGVEYSAPHAHAVRDIEFQTRLGDEVEPLAARIRRRTGSVSGAMELVERSLTFLHWKAHAPEKYRQGLKIAAAEFLKAADEAAAAKEAELRRAYPQRRPRGDELRSALSTAVQKKTSADRAMAKRKAVWEEHRRLEAQAAKKAQQEAAARKALADQLSGQMKARAAQSVEIRRENDPYGRPAFFVYRGGKKTTKYAYSKEKAMKLAGIA